MTVAPTLEPTSRSWTDQTKNSRHSRVNECSFLEKVGNIYYFSFSCFLLSWYTTINLWVKIFPRTYVLRNDSSWDNMSAVFLALIWFLSWCRAWKKEASLLICLLFSSWDLTHWPWQLSYLYIRRPIAFHTPSSDQSHVTETSTACLKDQVYLSNHSPLTLPKPDQLCSVLCSHFICNHQTSVCCWLVYCV